MINRATGEIGFRSGLHFTPQCLAASLATGADSVKTQALSLKGWHRHVFGFHDSNHGTFEVEALSTDRDRIQIVLLAHKQNHTGSNRDEGVARRALHDKVMAVDLAGQKEFSWGEVLHRPETRAGKDWLVVAYSREDKIPIPGGSLPARLSAKERMPEEIF